MLASVLVTLLTLLAGGVGFLNQALLAGMFGTGQAMDALLAATSIPTFLAGALGAALSYTATPHLVAARGPGYGRYGGTLHAALWGASAILFLLGGLAARPILRALCPALPPALLEEAVSMARISWITGVPALATVYLGCVQNASRRFVPVALAAVLPYLGMGAATLALGRTLGPQAVTLGLLGGTLAAFLLVAAGAGRSIRLWAWHRPDLPQALGYLGRIPLVLAAMACFTVFQSIDAFWGTRLGVGNLAALGYGQRILVAMGNLVIAGPSAVLMPRLAEAHLAGDPEAFLALVQRVARLVLACAAFAGLTAACLSRPLVRLLFQRGAFDQEAAARVASLLPFLLAGMAAMVTVVMLFRALFARHSLRGPAFVGLLCAASYFTLSGILGGILGLQGIGLAYAASWWLGLGAALALLAGGRIGKLLTAENGRFLLHLSASLGAVALALLAPPWSRLLASRGAAVLSLDLLALESLALVLFRALAVGVFGIPELVLLEGHLRRMWSPVGRPSR